MKNSIAEHICEIIKTQQYPSHEISFRKQDLLNIKSILSYSSALNVEQVKIECLSTLISLSLRLESIEEFSFANMYSLRDLTLYIESEINNDSLTKLFEAFPHIEELFLDGKFSNINLDSFFYLKKLTFSGNLLNDFNFDVFKNICNKLEKLSIGFDNINNKSIYKLLYGHHFSNLLGLVIRSSKITRLGNIFDGFPMLQSLIVYQSTQLKMIDKYAFSNLKNLKKLELSFNRELSEINPNLFSSLENLEELNLGNNKLRNFDLKIMDYIVNIKEINLNGNRIVNKKEIIDHFNELKIKYRI